MFLPFASAYCTPSLTQSGYSPHHKVRHLLPKMFVIYSDSPVKQALFLKQVPTVKIAKIPSCNTSSTVKCWSENLPSPLWAFPLYQQETGEHPVGTMLFILTRTLQSLSRYPLSIWLMPKWTDKGTQRVRHTLGDSLQPLGSKVAAKQQTSQDMVRFAEECLCLLWETLSRSYHPPFLHPGWAVSASDASCDRELTSSPVPQALLQGTTFPESIWELVWVSLCQPLLQACASVSSKRAARGWLLSASPKHLI